MKFWKNLAFFEIQGFVKAWIFFRKSLPIPEVTSSVIFAEVSLEFFYGIFTRSFFGLPSEVPAGILLEYFFWDSSRNFFENIFFVGKSLGISSKLYLGISIGFFLGFIQNCFWDFQCSMWFHEKHASLWCSFKKIHILKSYTVITFHMNTIRL